MKRRKHMGDAIIDLTGISPKALRRLVALFILLVVLLIGGKIALEAADPVLTEYQDSVSRECLALDHFDRKTGETTRYPCGTELKLRWHEQKEVILVETLPPLRQ